MKYKKILFIAGENLSARSGGQLATVAISNALAKQSIDFLRIACTTTPKTNIPHDLIGETKWIYGNTNKYLRRHLISQNLKKTVAHELQNNRPDLVVCRIGPATLAAQKICVKYRCPIVILARGLIRPDQSSSFLGKLLQKYYLDQYKKAMRCGDRVLCAYDEIADLAIKERKSTKSIEVVPNCVNPDEFPLVSETEIISTRGIYNIPGDAFLIGFAGSIQERHCLNTLLDALSLKKKETLNKICLLIIGEGPQLNQLKTKVNDLKFTDHVFFTGFIDRGNIGKLIGACDVLYGVQHPKYKSNPIKNYEYLSAGRLPIVSHSNELSFLKELDAGLFVSSVDPQAVSDCIYKAIQLTKEERLERALRGREYVVNHHTWDNFAKNILETAL